MTRLEIVRNQSNKINDGFLLVDKPQKMTCNDLCQVLKRRYNIKSCGHSGTLDPDATGVMILAFGRATKLLFLLDKEDKTYLATICYGILTDTLDIGGKIIGEKPVNITVEMVKEATTKLSLATTQIPPMMAAIKINGKKLYEYQRANQEVEVKPRACQIIDYELIEPLKIKEKNYTTSIKLHVTKGYYIRSFSRDLGDLMGTYATLLDLRRIKAGSIDISQCLTLDKILKEEISLISITDFLKYDTIEITENILKFVLNGVTLYPRNLINDSNATNINDLRRFILTYQGQPIAIYARIDNIFRPLFKF